jgi:signal peptidase I
MSFKLKSFPSAAPILICIVASSIINQFYDGDLSANEPLLSAEQCLALLEDGARKLRIGKTVTVSKEVKQHCKKLLSPPVPPDTPLPKISQCITVMQRVIQDGLEATLANLNSLDEKEVQPLSRCSEVVSYFYISSNSMSPKLQANDRVCVDRLIYKTQLPKRKEIVAFSPTESMKKHGIKEISMKRIIGIPGDTIKISRDIIYVNNRPLKKLYATSKSSNDYGPITVPVESYFVLGDNHSNSFDSRSWGFLPRSLIVGKVIWRYFPLNRTGAVW